MVNIPFLCPKCEKSHANDGKPRFSHVICEQCRCDITSFILERKLGGLWVLKSVPRVVDHLVRLGLAALSRRDDAVGDYLEALNLNWLRARGIGPR